MSKDKQNNILVPELRFSEFENDGEWEEKALNMIAKRITEKNKNGKVKSVFTNSAIDGIVNQREYFDKDIADKSKLENYYLVEIGDYVYNPRVSNFAPVGPISKNKTGVIGVMSPLYTVFSFIHNKDDFYEYYFETIHWCDSIRKVSNTGTRHDRMSITALDFMNIPVLYPFPAEQQKIANCLSSLDNLIGAETEKLNSLKDHKKGLLQQLFPTDGETVPQLRFPEFVDDGEWEEKRVDDFFNVGSSKRVLQKDWTDKGIPFYRTRELVSLSKNKPFGSEIFISKELFLELSKKYGVPTEGDFLVSGVGTLGISYQVKAEDKFYFKDGNVIWFKLEKGIVSDYFNYCFQSQFVQYQIFGQSSTSTVGTYTIQNAKKTKFWVPPTKEEQQKIANSLSSLDDLIEAQTEKIESLKEHKKGLMQQLFPATI